MTDYYIKLANKDAMPTVLSHFYNEDGNLVSNTSDYAIDVVGTLHESTGNTLTDDEGMEYPEMQAIDGWHVNIRLMGDAVKETVEALDTLHGVTPETPMRVWL